MPLSLGGFNHILNEGDTVLVKLNLLSAEPPSAAVTTHPSVVQAVIAMIKDAGAIPIFGDSPGGRSTAASFHHLLEVTGIATVADTCGCEVVCFDSLPVTDCAGKGRIHRKFTVTPLLRRLMRLLASPNSRPTSSPALRVL